MRFLFSLLVLTTLTFGQTFEVRDRNGVPVATVDNVKMFRLSEGSKQDIPAFQATVKNVSGADLVLDGINVTVHKKDGSKVEFSVNICDTRWCDFSKNSTSATTHSFSQPWLYMPDEFNSVEFSFSDSWWRDRFAAEENVKKLAAEAARQKRLSEEQDKKDAEESRRLRGTCALVYKITVDKKVSDLTVRQEQRVRACQGLGLYSPR